MPELTVRYRASDWTAARLLQLLNPTGFVALVAHAGEGDRFDPALRDAVSPASVPILFVEMAPSPGEPGEDYRPLFGARGDIFLVRPDGYVALAASAASAPGALHSRCKKWLSVDDHIAPK